MSNGLNVGSCSCRFEKGSAGSRQSALTPLLRPIIRRPPNYDQIASDEGLVKTIGRRRPPEGPVKSAGEQPFPPSSSTGVSYPPTRAPIPGDHAKYPEQPSRHRPDPSQRSAFSKEMSPLKATGNRGAKLELVSHSVGISKEWTDATVCIELRALGEWLW